MWEKFINWLKGLISWAVEEVAEPVVTTDDVPTVLEQNEATYRPEANSFTEPETTFDLYRSKEEEVDAFAALIANNAEAGEQDQRIVEAVAEGVDQNVLARAALRVSWVSLLSNYSRETLTLMEGRGTNWQFSFEVNSVILAALNAEVTKRNLDLLQREDHGMRS